MRKQRQKVITEVGRQLLQRERKRLIREQAELGRKLAAEAEATKRYEAKNGRKVNTESVAVSRGIVSRAGAVLASEGINVPIIANPSPYGKLSAWTDFDRIVVDYKLHDDPRLMAAILRGLLYHEGGHCRWTLPWRFTKEDAANEYRLLTGHNLPEGSSPGHMQRAWNALEDQRMETAVVSDSPRKAAYFTPMVMVELAGTLDNAAANYPLLIWRKYLPIKVRQGARKLFVLQHGAKGERLARGFEDAVDRYVRATTALDMYLAVIDMEKLLQEVNLAFNLDDAGHSHQGYSYRKTRKDFGDDVLTIPLPPEECGGNDSEGGDDEGEEPEFDPTDPEVARHLAEVFAHMFIDPWRLIPVIYVDPTARGEEGQGGEEGEDQGNPGSSQDEGDEGEGSDGTGETGDEGEGEGSGSKPGEHGESGDGSKGDSSDEGDESDQAGGEAAGEGTGDHSATAGGLTQDDLDQVIADAEAERNSDKALDEDVKSYRKALNDQSSRMAPYISGKHTDPTIVGPANALARQIERSFHAATIDRAPGWVEGERRGIVNALRYKTRRPGESEFYRAWVDDDQPGYDIAVSLLLDYSGSMEWAETKLAQCAYATKSACDRLGIPCTVLLWDNDAKCLWDATQKAQGVPVIKSAGGTDPSVAIADINSHRCDKAKHIVMIMTDGEWQGDWETPRKGRNLQAHSGRGRTIVGFGFGSYGASAEKLKGYGCDEAFKIDDLDQVPKYLERLLKRMA